jgi:hypothetical protein
MANLMANLAPVGSILPTFAEQKKSMVNYDKQDIISAEKAYDDWEACPIVSYVANTQIQAEFPSNRDFVWNTVIRYTFKYVAGGGAPTCSDLIGYCLMKNIYWYINSNQVGNTISGPDAYYYLISRTKNEDEKTYIIDNGGGYSFTLVSGTTYTFTAIIPGPANTNLSIFGEDATTFPLHVLNINNKKMKLIIDLQPTTLLFSSTTDITISQPEIWYQYTALGPNQPKQSIYKTLYYQIKPLMQSVALTSGSLIQFKLDGIKNPGELMGVILAVISDANNTAGTYFQTVEINKLEFWANNDRLMLWNNAQDKKWRYIERKNNRSDFTLNSTKYPFSFLPCSKKSMYSELVNLTTSGILVNQLANLYVNIDCTSTATYWVRALGIYKYQFNLDQKGDFTLDATKM